MSAAAEQGLQEGDVIVSANQQDMKAPADLQKQVEAVKKAGRKSIFLLVARQDDLRYVALKLDEPKPSKDKKPSAPKGEE